MEFAVSVWISGLVEKMADYEQAYWVGRGSMEPKHYLQVVSWSEFFRPDTVLDYGCGTGEYVHSWLDLGVEAYGYDVSKHAVSNSYGQAGGRCYNSLVELPLSRYDLVTCYDVLEHLTEAQVDETLRAIAGLATKDVLFSICMAGDANFERDSTHILCRSRNWWKAKLSEYFDVCDAPPGFLFAHQLIIGRARGVKW